MKKIKIGQIFISNKKRDNKYTYCGKIVDINNHDIEIELLPLDIGYTRLETRRFSHSKSAIEYSLKSKGYKIINKDEYKLLCMIN